MGHCADQLRDVGKTLCIVDGAAAIAREGVMHAWRVNSEQALVDGVFGVPTSCADDELFWGSDTTPMIEG